MQLEKTLRKAKNAIIGLGLSGAVIFGVGCSTFLYGAADQAGREVGGEFGKEFFKEFFREEVTKYIIACNYFKDLNNNGFPDYPDEFVGIKNKFREDEEILLVSADGGSRKGQLGRIELYNPLGELISKHETSFKFNGNVLWLDAKSVIPQRNYGNFKFVYYRNNKYAGSTDFEIVPSQ